MTLDTPRSLPLLSSPDENHRATEVSYLGNTYGPVAALKRSRIRATGRYWCVAVRERACSRAPHWFLCGSIGHSCCRCACGLQDSAIRDN